MVEGFENLTKATVFVHELYAEEVKFLGGIVVRPEIYERFSNAFTSTALSAFVKAFFLLACFIT